MAAEEKSQPCRSEGTCISIVPLYNTGCAGISQEVSDGRHDKMALLSVRGTAWGTVPKERCKASREEQMKMTAGLMNTAQEGKGLPALDGPGEDGQ